MELSINSLNTTFSDSNSINDESNYNSIKSISHINDRMTIIPTIDISEGRAVIVSQGKVVKDNGDPLDRADFLSINSDFQVVDLDRAMGIGDNSAIIQKICQKYPCYVAGGIRNLNIANEFLNKNAKRVVIGTAASCELLKLLPKNRTIIAFDVDQNFNLFFKGRMENSSQNLFEKIVELSEYISFISITFHYREGMGQGCDLNKLILIKEFLNEKKLNVRVAVAGGINSVQEIKHIINMGFIPQFGYGLWSGTFTLGDIYSQIMDYEKMTQYYSFKDMPVLLPCVLIATDGAPLGLTYTDSFGLKESIDTRKCVFYSRERKQRWLKGETSGNFQKLTHVSFNCDRTALIYIVEGNNFCHFNNRSCFNTRNPNKGGMLFLENILKKYFNDEKNNKISYSKKIFKNKTLQICKIIEESNEVWTASSKENKVHEISDLLYFLTLFIISNGIETKQLHNELIRRHFCLNKEVFVMNDIPRSLKIGICMNKHCEKEIFKFMERCGIIIKKSDSANRSLKYEGFIVNNPNVQIIPFLVKPKDVYRLFQYDLIDMVVCYQDIMDNYPINYIKLNIYNSNLGLKKSKICVIANEDFEINEYVNNKFKKLRIFSEYINLTNLWTEKKNIIAKIIPVSGLSEGYLINRLCDLVVSVVDTGQTVIQNKIKIIETIYESEMGIFAKDGFENTFESLKLE